MSRLPRILTPIQKYTVLVCACWAASNQATKLGLLHHLPNDGSWVLFFWRGEFFNLVSSIFEKWRQISPIPIRRSLRYPLGPSTWVCLFSFLQRSEEVLPWAGGSSSSREWSFPFGSSFVPSLLSQSHFIPCGSRCNKTSRQFVKNLVILSPKLAGKHEILGFDSF